LEWPIKPQMIEMFLDKFRPIAALFAAAVLVFGVTVGWLIASSTITWIENSQKAELEQAFYAGGIDWAEVEADGFLVTLSGEAESGEDQARAVKIASLVLGENLINGTTAQRAEVEAQQLVPPFVEILKNGDDFSFIGHMPQGETLQVFARFVDSLGADAKVTNVTESIENSAENWLPAFEYALRLAPLTDQAIINVSPGSVSLETVAISANGQQGFEEMAEKLRPESVNLTVDISAPRPVISPYVFVLDVANPDAAQCSAQDEAEASRIFTAVQHLIGTRVKCSVGIGAPSRQWREAIEAGLAALASLDGGRLEISDADVTLSAPDGTGLQEFEAIVQVLRIGLPDGFSLHSIASATPERRATVETRPIEFTTTLDANGMAIIEGSVKDNLTREVVMRFSEAKFGYGRVEDRLWLDETLPDGWQVRVFAMIEALALLNEGGANMLPDSLEIVGDASFEQPEAELARMLADPFKGWETELFISYTEPQGGEDGQGLDPRLCVSRITKLLTENNIIFAPSSAVISDPSIPTIEAIAAILTQCRDGRIEIGGHTDSQGREEMNRNLSQGRADAVLDALLAQNLLLGTITAKGYGEAEPIADNSTEEGRTRNRRIEFKLLRDEPEAAPEAASRVVIESFTRPAMRAPSQNQEPSE